MKISELIEILSTYPADKRVLLETTEGYHSIEHIYDTSRYDLVILTANEHESLYVGLPKIENNNKKIKQK